MMRRSLTALGVVVVLVGAMVADEGKDGIAELLVWPLAWANCLLIGCLLGWILERVTPKWQPPAFVYRWLDVFTPPEKRRP